jgi:hypothetical protein
LTKKKQRGGMRIHQAELAGSRKDRERTDAAAARAFAEGKIDLVEALGVSEEALSGLRRQAIALHEAGKHDRAIKIVLGLVALGRVHPVDPILLARCYAAIGNREAAAECSSHAKRMLEALDIDAKALGLTLPDLSGDES